MAGLSKREGAGVPQAKESMCAGPSKRTGVKLRRPPGLERKAAKMSTAPENHKAFDLLVKLVAKHTKQQVYSEVTIVTNHPKTPLKKNLQRTTAAGIDRVLNSWGCECVLDPETGRPVVLEALQLRDGIVITAEHPPELEDWE